MATYCCNNCYEKITDCRFTCLICKDFDLCHTCVLKESLNNHCFIEFGHDHNEHILMKICIESENILNKTNENKNENENENKQYTLIEMLKVLDAMEILQLS